ncbi:MAG TPA: lysophospholipid acyltransferase family protein [Chroococcales cyanobacterium]
MKKPLKDRKSMLVIRMLAPINKFAVARHFAGLEIVGAENLPSGRAFLLVANHTTRWDPSVVQVVLDRPANYMTSPNELRGWQGRLLPSVGSFPADPRKDLVTFAREQALRGEPIVVFPEGDIKRDGTTHQFKTGAAKIALHCASSGIDLPIVPMAIRYAPGKKERVQIMIAQAIDPNEYLDDFATDPLHAQRALATRMHREVCHLRVSLGELGDRDTVFTGKPVRAWMPRLLPSTRELSV